LKIMAVGTLLAALLAAPIASRAAVEFPFERQDGLLWLQVSSPASRKPLNFLLDTGASVSVVNLQTSDRLGLVRGEPSTVQGVQSVATGYWPTRVSASIGGVALPKDLLALDLAALGQSCSRRVDGLLGMDFLRDRIVQVDFAAGKIRILEAREVSSAGQTLPIRFGASAILAPISVNNSASRWVRLDTGCANGLQWVTTEIQPAAGQFQNAVALSALSNPMASVTVGLGSARLAAVHAGLHRTEIFPGEAGLLGNELLSRFDQVTIDAKGERLILVSKPAARISGIRR
jgi:hypothetical protein